MTGAGSDMALHLDAGHVGTIGDYNYDVALDLNRHGTVDSKDHDLVGPTRTASRGSRAFAARPRRTSCAGSTLTLRGAG